MTTTSLRERLADQAHKTWAGWTEYMFSRGTLVNGNNDPVTTIKEGTKLVIPSTLVLRWHRQMKTAFVDLPSTEQVSDLDIADDYQEVLDFFALENKVIVIPLADYEAALREAKESAIEEVRGDLLTVITYARSQAVGSNSKMIVACNKLLDKLGLIAPKV